MSKAKNLLGLAKGELTENEYKNLNKDIKILILTCNKDYEKNEKSTILRIIDNCKNRNLDYYVFNLAGGILNEGEELTCYNEGDKKGFVIDKNNTVVINRGSLNNYTNSLNILRRLESLGFFCINFRHTIDLCRNKYESYKLLVNNKINTPKSAIVYNEDQIDSAFKEIGGKFPIVAKTLTGSQGIGVFFIESEKSFLPVLQLIWKLKPDIEILLQEYIPIKYDVRSIVLKDKVIASMKRSVIDGDMRSNYSLGGKVEGYKLNKEEEDFVIKVAQLTKSTMCGVDFVSHNNNLYVIEINSSPGSYGIYNATKVDIISKLLDFIDNEDNWDYVTSECGVEEFVKIDNIGKIKAKFDTGNSASAIAFGVDNFKREGNLVKWEYNGKKFKSVCLKEVTINFNGNKHSEKRPVIELDIVFNGYIYKNVLVSLTDRQDECDLLINRHFMKLSRVSINPNKKYILS